MRGQFDKEWWTDAWNHRMKSIENVYGTPATGDSVISFTASSIETLVPGACARKFPVNDRFSLFLSSGMTQPLTKGGLGSDWEFGVYADHQAKWPYTMLFDLVEIWAEDRNHLSRG